MGRLTKCIGNGKCVIDVVRYAGGPLRDVTTFRAIWEAAVRVIRTCVYHGEGLGRGGYLGQIGVYLLTVTLLKL